MLDTKIAVSDFHMIRIKQESEPNVLKKFAELLGTEIKNWRLDIPERFGSGYCTGYIFNGHIRMLIFNYKLNNDLVIKNPDVDGTASTILFKFQNIFPETRTLLAGGTIKGDALCFDSYQKPQQGDRYSDPY